VLSAVTNIFGRSYQQLLPVFAVDVFGEGEVGLGFMFSAPGAGTLVGAAAITVLADIKRKGVLFLASMLAFSATLVLFSLNDRFLIGVGLLFVIGLTNIVFSSMMTTMLQLSAPAAMRGRVMSLVTVTMQGFAPFGALILGSIATRIGTPEAVALSAGVVALVAAAAALLAPQVRDFSWEPGETHEAPRTGEPVAAAGRRP
jgi:MFS family permease